MVSIKKELARISRSIKFWEELCKDYPKSFPYKITLNKLYKEKAEVASKIGRKK